MLARSGESKRPRGRNSMDNGTCSGGVAYLDGRYMPVEQATIPITDWGYRRSDVTYDVVRVWGGAFFRLEDHIRRFRASMQALRLDPARTDDEIRLVVTGWVRGSGPREGDGGV